MKRKRFNVILVGLGFEISNAIVHAGIRMVNGPSIGVLFCNSEKDVKVIEQSKLTQMAQVIKLVPSPMVTTEALEIVLKKSSSIFWRTAYWHCTCRQCFKKVPTPKAHAPPEKRAVLFLFR